MKSPSPTLRGYRSALRRHLSDGPDAHPDAAAALGARALKLGLGAADLVRIHEAALGSKEADIVRRAEPFLAMVTAVLADASPAHPVSKRKAGETIQSLHRLNDKLEAGNAALRLEVRRHQSAGAQWKAAASRSGRLLKESHRERESLRLLSRKLLSAQEDERKRISRDLHDVVAQALTGINVRLAGINLQTTADARKLLRKIAVAQKLLEQSMEVVHRFAVDLRPSVLDDLGLIPALSSYLRRFTEECGVTVSFTATPAVEQLDNASRTALYRIVQEGLANISRHAGARAATVRIDDPPGLIRLAITDDGKGFRTDKPAPANGRLRLGLLGMKERAEMVGGTFQLTSSPGKGTTIRVELPCPVTGIAATPRAARPRRR